MEPRGLMGGLYKFSEWIMRLSAVNILWIICSIPFVFLVFMFFIPFINGQIPEGQLAATFQSLAIYAGVIAPLTFFPSTAAMFTVTRKWVMGDTDVPIIKTFFKGYKENFKQSVIGGIIYTALILILIIDFTVYSKQSNIISYIFIAFLMLLIISAFNFFSMMVHYHMKTFQLLKNALLITIGKPIRSLSAAIMCGVILYVSFFAFTWLLPFFTASMIAFVSFHNFHLIYLKLQEQMEKMKQEEEESAEEVAEMDREDLVKTDQQNGKY